MAETMTKKWNRAPLAPERVEEMERYLSRDLEGLRTQMTDTAESPYNRTQELCLRDGTCRMLRMEAPDHFPIPEVQSPRLLHDHRIWVRSLYSSYKIILPAVIRSYTS